MKEIAINNWYWFVVAVIAAQMIWIFKSDFENLIKWIGNMLSDGLVPSSTRFYNLMITSTFCYSCIKILTEKEPNYSILIIQLIGIFILGGFAKITDIPNILDKLNNLKSIKKQDEKDN